jgi:hypothetical protein
MTVGRFVPHTIGIYGRAEMAPTGLTVDERGMDLRGARLPCRRCREINHKPMATPIAGRSLPVTASHKARGETLQSELDKVKPLQLG